LPGGTIHGFDVEVSVSSLSNNVKVKQLIIAGPLRARRLARRRWAYSSAGSPVTAGIYESAAERAPATTFFFSGGIMLFGSPNNHMRSNIVTANGDGRDFEAGLNLQTLATTANLVVENQFNENTGNGVQTIVGAADNDIVNNQMLRNLRTDALSDQTGLNRE
jgi:hypothetical protein